MGPWIALDLEMTGLDVQDDTILELAAVHVRKDLTEIDAISEVFAWPEQEPCQFVQDMHRASGLRQACGESTRDVRDSRFANWLRSAGATSEFPAHLIGFSVHSDLAFLRWHMPEAAALLSHQVIDCRSMCLVADAWSRPFTATASAPAHRAMDDARAALDCLRDLRDAWR